VIGSTIARLPNGSLGIELVEMFSAPTDTRGLVLVAADVSKANIIVGGQLLAGDAICAVGVEGELVRVEGLNYDATVEALSRLPTRSSSRSWSSGW